LRSRFIRNFSITFTTDILVFLLNITTSILVARALGPYLKGILAILVLYPTLLVIALDLGIPLANTYFASKERSKIDQLVTNSLWFGLVIGAFAIFITGFLVASFGLYFDAHPLLLNLMLLSVPFSLVSRFLSGVLLAKFKIVELNLITFASAILNLTGTIVGLVILNGGLMALTILFLLNSLTTFFFYLRMVGFAKGKWLSYNHAPIKEMLRFGLRDYPSHILWFLTGRVGFFLIGLLVGIKELGYFVIAVSMAELIWYLPLSVSKVLLPEVTSRQKEDTASMSMVLCRGMILAGLLFYFGVFMFGKRAIQILLGSTFLPSYPLLFLLMPGIIVTSAGHIMGTYIKGIGKPIISTYSTAFTFVTNTFLILVFVPVFGVEGAPLAITLTYILNFSIMAYYFRKYSGGAFRDFILARPRDFGLYMQLIREHLHIGRLP